jgi:hypothetical protein
MSTVTVVPTVDMASNPPRVQLVVTDVGTPNLFAATVTRLDPDGVWRNVRTSDGNPLVLTTSGANRVGTLSDYEARYGTPVTYSTLESAGTVSAPVTVNETRAWLVDPSTPALSVPIELRKGSFEEETWDVQQGIFYPMGRDTPVVQTDGTRKAPTTSVTVKIDTPEELAALRALLSGAGVLLLNIPASLDLGFDTSYVAVGKVTNRRVSDIGTDPYRAVELPITVVDMPIGGSQSSRSYGDLMDFSSYAALSAGYASYTALLAGP